MALDDATDGRESYPSGHAAYMFFSGTALSLYLLGKMKVLAEPSQVRADAVRLP